MKTPETIINYLQLTEKGTRITESENKYFFNVARDANKLEIQKAVEELFSVRVTKVNTSNRKGKRKKDRRQREGSRSRWKRAVVTLQTGDRIDLT